MTNPTSNFGWQMPTSTDLVTDLPADFEVFGQAVDTDFVDLLGGTTGQVLSKTSNTDLDFTWIAANPGDITGVTAGTGISGGGTSGTVTVTNDMATTITAAGDIVVGTGSGTYDNLPIGTTAQVLTADTTVSPYKVKWATPAATTLPTFSAYPTGTNQSIPATTFTKILFGTEAWDTAGNFASSTFTPTTAGYYQINVIVYMIGLNAGNDTLQIYKNGASYLIHQNIQTGTFSISASAVIYLNGTTDYVDVYFYKNGAGAATVQSGQAYTNFNGVGVRG